MLERLGTCMKGVRARGDTSSGLPGIYWEGLPGRLELGEAERKQSKIIMLMGPHLNVHVDGPQRHTSYFIYVLERSS